MEKMTLYEIRLDDGTKEFYSTQDYALIAAEKRGATGADLIVTTVEKDVLYDGESGMYYIVDGVIQRGVDKELLEKIRQRALVKLTPVEKIALSILSY